MGHVIKDEHEFYLDVMSHPIGNINIAETMKAFGYDPLQFNPFSSRKIIANCSFCLKRYETSLNTLNKSKYITCRKCTGISSQYALTHSELTPSQFFVFLKSKHHEMVTGLVNYIDVDMTIEKFGYDPLTLSPNSSKRVVSKCQYCNDEITPSMASLVKRNGTVSCSRCTYRKTIETIQSRYGVSSAVSIPHVKAKLSNPQTERLVESVLQKFGVSFERQYQIGPYTFDFHVPMSNLLIECQGDFFHDFKHHGYLGTPRDKGKATYIANNTKYKLIHIWEHEIHLGRLSVILSRHIIDTPNQLSFDLKALRLRSISNDDASSFLSQYHYLGSLPNSSNHYGGFHEDELVAVCSFGSTTRQMTCKRVNKLSKLKIRNCELKELKRFCIRHDVKVMNMASFLLKRFLQLIQHDKQTKAVISFSDPTVGHDGSIYKVSGWIKLGETSKSYHYLDMTTMKAIHKKTVYERARNLKMTEREFVEAVGLIKVPESPKSLWMKTT